MSAKREERFCLGTLCGEFPWQTVLLEAFAHKIIVHDGGQYGKDTQRVSWSSSFE